MAEPLRINLGAGDSQYTGYTSIDLYDDAADIKADLCDLPFENNSVDEILCLQTVEHIAYYKTQKMFMEMYRVLKPGCKAHIECPDLLYAAREIMLTGDIDQKWIQHIYGEYHRPWDVGRYGEGAVDYVGARHVTGFTFKRIQRICGDIGFQVEDATRKFMDVPETLAVDLIKPIDAKEIQVELDTYGRR